MIDTWFQFEKEINWFERRNVKISESNYRVVVSNVGNNNRCLQINMLSRKLLLHDIDIDIEYGKYRFMWLLNLE